MLVNRRLQSRVLHYELAKRGRNFGLPSPLLDRDKCLLPVSAQRVGPVQQVGSGGFPPSSAPEHRLTHHPTLMPRNHRPPVSGGIRDVCPLTLPFNTARRYDGADHALLVAIQPRGAPVRAVRLWAASFIRLGRCISSNSLSVLEYTTTLRVDYSGLGRTRSTRSTADVTDRVTID
eukprot:COSAG02_NODE_10681_length_1884_cov_4.393277_2_plen_176_part_00